MKYKTIAALAFAVFLSMAVGPAFTQRIDSRIAAPAQIERSVAKPVVTRKRTAGQNMPLVALSSAPRAPAGLTNREIDKLKLELTVDSDFTLKRAKGKWQKVLLEPRNPYLAQKAYLTFSTAGTYLTDENRAYLYKYPAGNYWPSVVVSWLSPTSGDTYLVTIAIHVSRDNTEVVLDSIPSVLNKGSHLLTAAHEAGKGWQEIMLRVKSQDTGFTFYWADIRLWEP